MAPDDVTPPPLDGTAVDAAEFGSAFALWLAARGVAELVQQVAAPHGWSADEFAVATMIRARDSLTTVEVARWMASPVSTASSLLRRMEGRGELERRRKASDARASSVSLTEVGLGRYEAIAAAFEPASRAIDEAAASLGLTPADFAALRVRIGPNSVGATQ